MVLAKTVLIRNIPGEISAYTNVVKNLHNGAFITLNYFIKGQDQKRCYSRGCLKREG